MFAWIKQKTELQKLQHAYCKLMKHAYKLALTDKSKSDRLHDEANQILSQIKKIENQSVL
ncbi:Lacal_2735 family protein [Aquimarina sp. AD10]|uniref:Lacal_2735 family protein n=1 Tax=Aquimarina TaxID=290174 RepID=UPI000E4ED631|nr:Lacal_2735 family protein [Aquimarina aggregata]AXT63250.1 Lacal_2735 family protein [Aquimarina sp. AD10]RKN00737.1 Lacal_2735 family protein [Aquimarina sp. AD10]